MSAPRFDRDAERSVLGAILSAGALGIEAGHRLLARVEATGLVADHFYSASRGVLFSELQAIRDEDLPLDALSVSAALERRAEEAVGPLGELLVFNVSDLRARLHELAAEVTAVGNVEFHAGVVVREHERRMREAA